MGERRDEERGRWSLGGPYLQPLHDFESNMAVILVFLFGYCSSICTNRICTEKPGHQTDPYLCAIYDSRLNYVVVIN